jgi:hypothetical protein
MIKDNLCSGILVLKMEKVLREIVMLNSDFCCFSGVSRNFVIYHIKDQSYTYGKSSEAML